MSKKNDQKQQFIPWIIIFLAIGFFICLILWTVEKTTHDPGVLVDQLETKISSFSDTTQQKNTQKFVSDLDNDIVALKQTLSSQRIAVLAYAGILSLAMALCILGLFYFIIRKFYLSSLDNLISGTNKIARGDLSIQFNTNQTGNIEKLTGSLNQMTRFLHKTLMDIAGFIESLTFSSSELGTVFRQMSSNADETFKKTDSVSSLSNEMSSEMTAIASAMEQSTYNVTQVAGNINEMNDSINETFRFVEKTEATTKQAVEQARIASEKIEQLGKAAGEIGQVTETIHNISSQTDLLALNATIEAARAGEAGKGFAVVANEIKALASQTAEATGNIDGRIKDICSITEETVQEITNISKAINDVSQIVSSMVSIVEKQSATAQSVTGNIQQAANGINDVNDNVNKSSAAANKIADEIRELSVLASGMNQSGNKIRVNSDELNKLAEKFKSIFNAIEFGQARIKSSKEDAKNLVEKGLAYLSQHGKESSFSAFNDPKGGFIKDDLYLFVQDFEGLTIVHGANATLIGKNFYHAKDEDGNQFFKQMIDTAKIHNSGWVKYKWSHPETKQVMKKIAYVSRIPGEDQVLGCGAYDN